MKILSQFQRWFTSQHSPDKMLITKAFFVDLDLLKRCARIIRGEEPGREPRLDGTKFPAWGQADLEGRALVWSGPFSFDLDIKYKLLSEALPGLYVSDPRPSYGLLAYDDEPILTFVIAESATWATLWPRTDHLPQSKDK